MLTRRHLLATTLAAPAILRFGPAQAATTLKISHQFPGGTIDNTVLSTKVTPIRSFTGLNGSYIASSGAITIQKSSHGVQKKW